MRRMIWLVAWVMVAAGGARGETVLERVLKSTDAVQSMSCEIRRDSPLPDGQTLRLLSRVYYERPDKLHVENFSPVKRRTISDGVMFRQYTEGAARGFARPVSELNDEMLRNLRMVPGSAANMLEILRGAEEVALEGTAEFPTRAGYDNGKAFAVLSLDGEGRLARVEIFDSRAQNELRSSMEFSAFQEVLPGVWIACHQLSKAMFAGVERQETTRVDNITANCTIPASLFVAEPFFPGVEFVDAFEKIAP
ncbi:MAG: LolA family protein [Kiritimatiellia bacterium]|jgi:outer membrane lipoprotein-sorting protein